MIVSRSGKAGGSLALTVFLAGCAAWQLPEQNAEALAALPIAARCEAELPFFGYYRYSRDEATQYMAPDGRIVMGQDGGWCMIRYQVAMVNSAPVMARAEVRQAPTQGSVMVGTLDGLLRIAYRPNPGFMGQDAFLVSLHGPVSYVVPVRVFVGP